MMFVRASNQPDPLTAHGRVVVWVSTLTPTLRCAPSTRGRSERSFVAAQVLVRPANEELHTAYSNKLYLTGERRRDGKSKTLPLFSFAALGREASARVVDSDQAAQRPLHRAPHRL